MGNASDPKIFVRNRLAIMVQKGNPKGIRKLADFKHADAARVWIDYLLTPQGQAVLAKYGFIPAA